MSQLTDRLRTLAASVTFSEREQQDIRDVAKLYELADKWLADPAQRNVASLASHLKAMRLTEARQ